MQMAGIAGEILILKEPKLEIAKSDIEVAEEFAMKLSSPNIPDYLIIGNEIENTNFSQEFIQELDNGFLLAGVNAAIHILKTKKQEFLNLISFLRQKDKFSQKELLSVLPSRKWITAHNKSNYGTIFWI